MSFVGLHAHGGHCCGVTHVHLGGWTSPDVKIDGLMKFDTNKLAQTARGIVGYLAAEGRQATVYIPNFINNINRPEEPVGERIDALVKYYITQRRGSGILELVLIDNQRKGWEPYLFDRGWRHVGQSYNSNSQNTCHVYLLEYRNGRAGPAHDIIPYKEVTDKAIPVEKAVAEDGTPAALTN